MDRIDRVNEQIKREIGVIIQQELADPRLRFVTITNVDVSRDLRTAKVYFSALADRLPSGGRIPRRKRRKRRSRAPRGPSAGMLAGTSRCAIPLSSILSTTVPLNSARGSNKP